MHKTTFYSDLIFPRFERKFGDIPLSFRAIHDGNMTKIGCHAFFELFPGYTNQAKAIRFDELEIPRLHLLQTFGCIIRDKQVRLGCKHLESCQASISRGEKGCAGFTDVAISRERSAEQARDFSPRRLMVVCRMFCGQLHSQRKAA